MPTQPSVRWVPGSPSPVVKRPEREADLTPTSSAEIKNEWSCTYTPDIRLDGADRDNFTFIFSLFYQFSSCLFCVFSIDVSVSCQARDQALLL